MILSSLVKLATELNSTLEIVDLVNTVVSKAMETLGADACVLFLLDPKTGAISHKAMSVTTTGKAELVPCSISHGHGIAGTVAQTGRPLCCNDIASAPLLHAAEQPGFPVKNIMSVPLKARKIPIGVIQVFNHASGFTEDDLQLFIAFADIAAVSLANARMHQQAARHRKLEHEMDVAKDIQKSFLPQSFPAVPGLSFEAMTEPARQVGGDYYDIFTTPQGLVCTAVGDVSGKGAAASLYMACLHSELHMAMEFVPSPAKVMHRLNNIMFKRSRRGAFVTLLLILIEPQSRRACILSAGHPAPLLHDGRTVVSIERENGFPLGVRADENYAETWLDLPQGSVLLGYTDGITEARNRAGEIFGTGRLCQYLQAACNAGKEVIPVIHRGVRDFVGRAPQYDDITMALIRVGQD